MSTPRRPGAQPGNTNALKHGFYARKFRPQQLDDYTRAAAITGLDQEIALIRFIIFTLVQRCLPSPDQPLDSAAFAALETSFARLTRLLRDQRLLSLGDTDPAAVLAPLFAAANAGLPFTRLFPPLPSAEPVPLPPADQPAAPPSSPPSTIHSSLSDDPPLP